MTTQDKPAVGPLSADEELIERGLRAIRTYDTVRYLRDALSATTARLTGYDWNADPDLITKQQGDAFAAADKVFSDLDAAVASHPDIYLPECETCGGTGKIEESARMEGANQHSACVRSCDECDGCGFAPDPSLAPTAPVEADGSERDAVDFLLDRLADFENEISVDVVFRDWNGYVAPAIARVKALRPQPSGETREAVAARIRRLVSLADADFSFVAREAYVSKETDAILALLRPAAPGGGLADLAARVTAEVKRGADGSHAQALGALSNIEAMVRSAIPARKGARDDLR